jgi:small subunit ribosomal protein S8
MITDPIADMFTRIRNANRKLLEKIDVPSSKLKIEVAKILKEEGFITNYKNIEDYKQGVLRIYLKYTVGGEQVLLGLKRVSRPGLRRYAGYLNFPKIDGSMGVAIISTSKGIMTDKKAKREKLGGEILGFAW